jgi:hypothetical protein
LPPPPPPLAWRAYLRAWFSREYVCVPLIRGIVAWRHGRGCVRGLPQASYAAALAARRREDPSAAAARPATSMRHGLDVY